MKREYPYLQSPYYEDAISGQERRDFLATIDNYVNQKQYVRITLLNWQENPLKEIAGELTSGSLTKDGSSSIRTTCSLQASVNGNEYSIEDSEMDFAINKKIFIEIGVKNYSNLYKEYPILWFPQGVFFITDFNISSSATSSVNISLNLKDKMAALNGEIGGTFPATTVLDEMDTQSPSGAFISKKVLVHDIIQEVVNHWGGEDLNNIVIEDVPLRIKRVMKWTGSEPVWLIPEPNTSAQAGNLWYHVETEYEGAGNDGNSVDNEDIWAQNPLPIQVQNGTDAGYIYDDFYYTSELVMQPGQTVVDALDQIKQYVGNYEYFYDVFGVFHFREIKNYMNTTQGKIVLDDMSKNDYLVEVTTNKSEYTFSDDSNLISITANPQYGNIKNDYIIQGKRQMTSSDISYPVRYHLSIDKKPKPGNTYYDLLLFEEKDTNLTKAIFPLNVATESDLPIPGNFNLIYRVKENNSFVYWENDIYKEVNCIAFYPADGNSSGPEFFKSGGYTTKDWRTELYLQGLLNKNNGTSANMALQDLKNDYSHAVSDETWIGNLWRKMRNQQLDIDFYFEELDAFWPTIYDLSKQQFYAENEDKTLYTSALTDGNYYLDFIDPQESQLGEFCVENIGRRTQVTVNDDINCLFQPDIPDIVFLNIDDDDFTEKRAECQKNGQPFTQVRGDIFYNFATGGYKNGAFDQIKYELYIHTNYQKTLSLVAIPNFYLMPNTRVTLNDKTTNTYGDFVIQNITLPLGPGGNMSVTCSECFERF